jgi:hypothetical protein
VLKAGRPVPAPNAAINQVDNELILSNLRVGSGIRRALRRRSAGWLVV